MYGKPSFDVEIFVDNHMLDFRVLTLFFISLRNQKYIEGETADTVQVALSSLGRLTLF